MDTVIALAKTKTQRPPSRTALATRVADLEACLVHLIEAVDFLVRLEVFRTGHQQRVRTAERLADRPGSKEETEDYVRRVLTMAVENAKEVLREIEEGRGDSPPEAFT